MLKSCILIRTLHCIFQIPFFRLHFKTFGVLLKMVGDKRIIGIFKVWILHQRLKSNKDFGDLEGWAPAILQDVKTDASKAFNVRVINFCPE